MVVVDDVYLHLGKLRLRAKGSSGGHNGLKNIEAKLKSQIYPRLKMGVGPQEGEFVVKEDQSLESYVLGCFSKAEEEILPQFLENAACALEHWLDEGIDDAIQRAGESRPITG